ncbi:MAG: dihydrodipicolinate synthase family protein, partial [Daejeonella sp.]|nr:dihydrodipicolinate synthase family protein [Daejeonella sp.]
MSTKTLDPVLKSLLQSGTVLPAIPLALNSSRQFDEARQRGLARYYFATGAGGLAVAVHSTQFEIRDPEINLFETVLRVVSEEIDNSNPGRPFIKIAGICGPTAQAVKEAETACKYG